MAVNINSKELEGINSPPFEYDIECQGKVSDSDIRCEKFLIVMKWSRFILLINDSFGSSYQNGSFGTVLDIEPDKLKIKIDDNNEVIELQKNVWEIYGYDIDKFSGRIKKILIGTYRQMPVRLGWAVTIHKSQERLMMPLI